EDGIRDRTVTGVQTCALPIFIVSLGGQTPLKLAARLPRELVAGTSPESIDLAEDRERWNALCARLEIPQPAGGTAVNVADALARSEERRVGKEWRYRARRDGG